MGADAHPAQAWRRDAFAKSGMAIDLIMCIGQASRKAAHCVVFTLREVGLARGWSTMLRRLVEWGARCVVRAMGAGQRKRWTVSRAAMYRQIADFSTGLPRGGRVLDISGSSTLIDCMQLAPSERVEVHYPEVSILALPFPDASFDWAVSDQCLEHIVGDPGAAMREVMRVLKPGGQMLHTTCFVTPYHGGGGLADFWRFSPEALAYLCRDAAQVHADGSGNPLANLLTSLLPFEPVPEAPRHPLNRLLDQPSRGHTSMVWVWARKG